MLAQQYLVLKIESFLMYQLHLYLIIFLAVNIKNGDNQPLSTG